LQRRRARPPAIFAWPGQNRLWKYPKISIAIWLGAANAYRLADGDEDRAVTLFSSGYYYTAHQKKMLATLRTASSPTVASESPPPPEPQR
jgi:hypothetical protein